MRSSTRTTKDAGITFGHEDMRGTPRCRGIVGSLDGEENDDECAYRAGIHMAESRVHRNKSDIRFAFSYFAFLCELPLYQDLIVEHIVTKLLGSRRIRPALRRYLIRWLGLEKTCIGRSLVMLRTYFRRTAWASVPGIVERVEYDRKQSAHIALVRHKKKCPAIPNQQRPDQMAYIICPVGLAFGQEVVANRDAPGDVKVCSATTLTHRPVGTVVHNIDLRPGFGGQLCRSAGTSARVFERDETRELALLRLQSKELRLVRLQCMVSIGQVSNPEHKNQSFGKANRMRWKGIHPHVQGVAMNPIDHPYRGGEGKTSGGRPSVSKWGKPTKGYRTRSKKKENPHIVKRRFQNQTSLFLAKFLPSPIARYGRRTIHYAFR